MLRNESMAMPREYEKIVPLVQHINKNNINQFMNQNIDYNIAFLLTQLDNANYLPNSKKILSNKNLKPSDILEIVRAPMELAINENPNLVDVIKDQRIEILRTLIKEEKAYPLQISR